jgi:hypothetical protein
MKTSPFLILLGALTVAGCETHHGYHDSYGQRDYDDYNASHRGGGGYQNYNYNSGYGSSHGSDYNLRRDVRPEPPDMQSFPEPALPPSDGMR